MNYKRRCFKSTAPIAKANPEARNVIPCDGLSALWGIFMLLAFGYFCFVLGRITEAGR